MSRADVERADAAADAAAGAAFLAAGALAVAAVVKNGDVGGDDFSKTII